MHRLCMAALGLCVLWGIAACVRVEAPRADHWRAPRLMMARDMHGVRVEWASEKNTRYALVYRDLRLDHDPWKPLPDYGDIRGTGGIVRVNLTHPNAKHFEYRLRRSEKGKAEGGRNRR